jgi:type VI protein secretion system component VasK
MSLHQYVTASLTAIIKSERSNAATTRAKSGRLAWGCIGMAVATAGVGFALVGCWHGRVVGMDMCLLQAGMVGHSGS